MEVEWTIRISVEWGVDLGKVLICLRAKAIRLPPIRLERLLCLPLKSGFGTCNQSSAHTSYKKTHKHKHTHAYFFITNNSHHNTGLAYIWVCLSVYGCMGVFRREVMVGQKGLNECDVTDRPFGENV